MKKNDVFTFTAPNGVEVQAVVIDLVAHEVGYKWIIKRWLCYAQNRLFTYEEHFHMWDGTVPNKYKYGKVIADYAILPDYDDVLQLHTSMEYPQWEQNLEAEIQGMNDR